MKEYENKSFEEIRVEDYLANRKCGNQTQASTFGTPSTSNTGSLFGQTNTNTNTGFSFGNSNQPKLFGAGTGFGGATTQRKFAEDIMMETVPDFSLRNVRRHSDGLRYQ